MQEKLFDLGGFDCLWGADLSLRASTQHMPILHITLPSIHSHEQYSALDFLFVCLLGFLLLLFFKKFIGDFKSPFSKPIKANYQVRHVIMCFLPPELGTPYTPGRPVFEKTKESNLTPNIFPLKYCVKRGSLSA